MDLEGKARSAKCCQQVLVVAERLVQRLAAAAKRGARQGLDSAVLTSDLDLTRDKERSIAHRRDPGWLTGILIRQAIMPLVQQCPARTPPHDLSHRVCAAQVGQNPWSPIELENTRVAAQTLPDMDA
jgi:hypothetical protein